MKHGRPCYKVKLVELFAFLEDAIDIWKWGLSPERLPDSAYLVSMLATLDPNHEIFKVVPAKSLRLEEIGPSRSIRQDLMDLELISGKSTRGFFKHSAEEKLTQRLGKFEAKKKKQ